MTSGCAAVDKPIEFVLVDGGLIQSKSVAIQIGDQTRAPMTTLVFQNVTIQQSHRHALYLHHSHPSAAFPQLLLVLVSQPAPAALAPYDCGTHSGEIITQAHQHIVAVLDALHDFELGWDVTHSNCLSFIPLQLCQAFGTHSRSLCLL